MQNPAQFQSWISHQLLPLVIDVNKTVLIWPPPHRRRRQPGGGDRQPPLRRLAGAHYRRADDRPAAGMAVQPRAGSNHRLPQLQITPQALG